MGQVNSIITLITKVQDFKFDNSSLTIRVSFTFRFQLVNWVQCWRTFLLILMMSSTLWFSTYSRWTCQKIWDEGTITWLNHSYQRDGVCVCLICVSFVLQVPSWSLPTDRCVAFTVSMTIIVSTTNVGWRRSCWDSAFTTPDWSRFLTPTRHSLMNFCLLLSTRSTWSLMMGAAWLITWQRPPWSCTRNSRRCCRPVTLLVGLWFGLIQWASTVWMHVMISLKTSRHGLVVSTVFFSTSRTAQH